jgi:hypothetical protein
MLVQLGFNHLGSSIYNHPPPAPTPHYPYSFRPCRCASRYVEVNQREGCRISRKGVQPFQMEGGKDGRLVCPDALAARSRKPKSLLCGPLSWL